MIKNIIILLLLSLGCFAGNSKSENKIKMNQQSDKLEIITFGAGCFWCVEAVFSELKGVTSVVSGYTGGATDNPTYKEICTGNTGHAEVAQITYNPAVISYDLLLSIFWKTHDPTTLNQQGADRGTQYRSVIFYSTEKQKKTALKYKKELNDSGAWERPIVTEIVALGKFYLAENYHQDYYENNGSESYCRYVIQPKVDKFKKVFKEYLK